MITTYYMDLETTGLNAYHNEITEIAIVRTKESEKAIMNTLVKTTKPIPHSVVRLNGISNELVEKEGVSYREMMDNVIDFLQKNTPEGNAIWFIGHNVIGFDRVFFEHSIRKYNYKHPEDPIVMPDIYWMDTLPMAKYTMPEKDRHRLQSLVPKEKQLHRALGDCKMVHTIYRDLIRTTTRNLTRDYPEVMRACKGKGPHFLYKTIASLLSM